jgi:molecular chaperone DnaK (HSP70)
MRDSRFIIGIDLGTTNIAVTFVDTYDRDKKIELFKIPQFSAPGEVSESELLPSFCCFPDKKLLPNSMRLPWKSEMEYAVGIFARDYGSAVPNRFVSSTKSWLCHAGVNRKGKLLPWGSEIENILKSPVEITSYFLEHIKKAWDNKFAKVKDLYGNPCVLIDQQIVITIPASFDETARELTVESAKKAGYKNINLLEEALAAFYSWLDYNCTNWTDIIKPHEKVLILDIGGGTCDFSMIEMSEEGSLVRTAAGNHLLLGGDNIDIAIARIIEKEWNTRLSNGEWLTLCQKTRDAKEKLLSTKLETVDVVLLSQGSSVVGSVKKYTLNRNLLKELIVNGFFPVIPSDTPAPQKKSGIQTMGLPYVADPALTKYLLHFLKYANKVSLVDNKAHNGLLKPDKVLFNGGTMIPDIIRQQIMNVIHEWFSASEEIVELSSRDLSLAVAYGASYYAKTRRGEGVKVKSGTVLSYFLKVSSKADKKESFVCVMPRGIDENVDVTTPRNFSLAANCKVQFPLYSSATRLGDITGNVINNNEELSFISSLISVLRFGKTEKKELKAEIVTELTETGVLKIWLQSKESHHKWPLNFDIRLLSAEEDELDVGESIILDIGQVKKACEAINDAFISDLDCISSVTKHIEKLLDLPKNQWPIHALRSFADSLLNIPYELLKTPRKEAKWLNLCGFCLRPGFGDPEDELRLKKAWKLWFNGMNNQNNSQVVAEWWVFWRRIVSGLKSGHQRSIYEALSRQICPKGIYSNKVKAGIQAKTEMWRCMGALELLHPKQKIALGEMLLSRKDRLDSFDYWVLARLGARHLFHAQVNNVVSGNIVSKWLDILIKHKANNALLQDKLFALSRMAALTGDRAIDVDAKHLSVTLSFLEAHKTPEQWTKHLNSVRKESVQEQNKILGDTLPLGLSIV